MLIALFSHFFMQRQGYYSTAKDSLNCSKIEELKQKPNNEKKTMTTSSSHT